MVSFAQQGNTDLVSAVAQLRDRSLTDVQIMDELTKKGYPPDQVSAAITEIDQAPPLSGGMSYPQAPAYPAAGQLSSAPAMDGVTSYERIAEIAENIIDEKWDQLIAEVRKIVDWKEKVEEKQRLLANDVQKMKDDFKILHQGVLGKLDDYDARMRDVGTELNAVGKVFKDVVPEFVENVKELSSLTGRMKKK